MADPDLEADDREPAGLLVTPLEDRSAGAIDWLMQLWLTGAPAFH
jgi:hypothetical protein